MTPKITIGGTEFPFPKLSWVVAALEETIPQALNHRACIVLQLHKPMDITHRSVLVGPSTPITFEYDGGKIGGELLDYREVFVQYAMMDVLGKGVLNIDYLQRTASSVWD